MATSERGHAYTLAEVAAFLDGDAPLDGVWFDEPHPTESGAFWWRKHLRAALSAAEARERRLRETLAQSRDHLRGLMWDRMDFTEREIAAAVLYIDAALTEGERDG